MNKKIIIIVSCVGIVSLLGLAEFFSYKNITVDFAQTESAAIFYTKNEKEITKLSGDGTIRLKPGDYSYVPQGDKLSSNRVVFTVRGAETIRIDPPFSKSHLQSLLSARQNQIQSTLSAKYPVILTDFTTSDETLYHHGEWYSARLVQRTAPASEPDVYRVILKLEDNIWRVIVSPRLIINKNEFPAVPESYITNVNKQSSVDAYSQ